MQELQAILEKIERPRKDELLPAWLIRDNILSFVAQALAKLKEEPEPTEFTKEWRKRFVESESFMAISGAKESQIMEEMRKACDIIDQLQAENKKLVEGQKAMKGAGS